MKHVEEHRMSLILYKSKLSYSERGGGTGQCSRSGTIDGLLDIMKEKKVKLSFSTRCGLAIKVARPQSRSSPLDLDCHLVPSHLAVQWTLQSRSSGLCSQGASESH